MSTAPLRLAVVALSALVILSGCSKDDEDPSPSSSSDGSSDREITLPDSVGDLPSFEDACAARDENVDQCLDNAEARLEVALAAADNLSEAYDGASATAREYAAEELDQFAEVLAVAASSPGLWTTDSEASAEYSHIGHPREWVEERDGVQCLAVTPSLVRQGEELEPDNVIVTRCQATGDGLTVIVIPGGGETTFDEAFEWTNEAFDAAS